MEAFAWPIIVLILGVIGMLIFRQPLQRLIDRAEKISKEGIQTRAIPEQAKEPKSSAVEDFLKRVYDNQLLREAEDLIRSHLESLKPGSPEERERFLLRNLAAATIIQAFERIYYFIYGSQITTLRFLNDSRNTQITPDEVVPFFEEAKRRYPDLYSNDTFERWLSFLTTWVLIRNDNNRIAITVRGKEFLKYLVDQGFSFIKLG